MEAGEGKKKLAVGSLQRFLLLGTLSLGLRRELQAWESHPLFDNWVRPPVSGRISLFLVSMDKCGSAPRAILVPSAPGLFGGTGSVCPGDVTSEGVIRPGPGTRAEGVKSRRILHFEPFPALPYHTQVLTRMSGLGGPK